MKTPILAMAICCIAAIANAATIIGPTPYLALSDTPEGVFSDGHLVCAQDFEDADGPWEVGFSIDFGQRIGPKFTSGQGVPVTDSVDADDNSIDGDGTMGSSWFSATRGLTITFDDPTPSAGFVFTDADSRATTVTVTAYAEDGTELISETFDSFFDDVFTGTTQEDRFFGVVGMDGETIKRLSVSIDRGNGIEIDHVQFAKPIPEPATMTLAFLAVGSLLGLRRRRR